MNRLYTFCTQLVENILILNQKFGINNHLLDITLSYDELEDCCYIYFGLDDKIMKFVESLDLYESQEAYEEGVFTPGVIISDETDLETGFFYNQQDKILAYTVTLYCAAVTEIYLTSIRMEFI